MLLAAFVVAQCVCVCRVTAAPRPHVVTKPLQACCRSESAAPDAASDATPHAVPHRHDTACPHCGMADAKTFADQPGVATPVELMLLPAAWFSPVAVDAHVGFAPIVPVSFACLQAVAPPDPLLQKCALRL